MDEDDLFDEFGNYIGPECAVDEYPSGGYADQQQGDGEVLMDEGGEEEVNQRFAMVSIARCTIKGCCIRLLSL
jgi:hypothetical protein